MLCIGSLKLKNRLMLAPMSGRTNLPFRLIIKKMGAGLVTTEMISSEGLARAQKKTFTYLETHPDEGPLSAQLFGSDPDRMALSAQIIEERGLDIVDINMGCPVRKVVKSGAGSALMRNPEKAAKIVSAVRKKTSLPLTVKIRSGWSPKEANAVELVKVIEENGADGIIIHPRFAIQGFSGEADWQIIKNVKENVKVPVIGSGDVKNPHSAILMRKQTGCDGIMIGRAALTNPWIFKQILDLEKGEPFKEVEIEERYKLIQEHFSLLAEYFGEKRGTNIMKGQLLLYTKGLPDKKILRDIMHEIDGKEKFNSNIALYFKHIKGRITHEG